MVAARPISHKKTELSSLRCSEEGDVRFFGTLVRWILPVIHLPPLPQLQRMTMMSPFTQVSGTIGGAAAPLVIVRSMLEAL